MSDMVINVSDYQGKEIEDISPIVIMNNSSISLDISQCQVEGEQVYKASIDFGDDIKESFSQPIGQKSLTIEQQEKKQWNVIEHRYNFNERFVYDSDILNASLPRIMVTLYNRQAEKDIVEIPFKVFYKSFYELDMNIDVEQANLTNECTVSYILSNNNSELIVVHTKDWRRIYGSDADIVKVSNPDTPIVPPLNYYVDDDTSVWNWKTKPFMNWIDEPFVNDNGLIEFAWTEGGVAFDETLLFYKLGSDDSYITVDITNVPFVVDERGTYKKYIIPLPFEGDMIQFHFKIKGENNIESEVVESFFRSQDCVRGKITPLFIEDNENNLIARFAISDARYIDLSSIKINGWTVSEESFLEIPKTWIENGENTFVITYNLYDKEAIGQSVSYDDIITIDYNGFAQIDNYELDRNIHISFNIAPIRPYKIWINYIINKEQYKIEVPVNNGIEGDSSIKYEYLIDGTMVDDGEVEMFISGSLVDPVNYPNNGRSFESEHITFEYNYPELDDTEVKTQRFCDFEYTSQNGYVFEPFIRTFISRNPYSYGATLNYLRGDEAITENCNSLNMIINMYGADISDIQYIDRDKRDTIYQRNRTRDIELSEKDIDYDTFNDMIFRYDNLQYVIGRTYLDSDSNKVFFNDIKSYSLHKINKTHEDNDGNYYYIKDGFEPIKFTSKQYTENITDGNTISRYVIDQNLFEVNEEDLIELEEIKAELSINFDINQQLYTYIVSVQTDTPSQTSDEHIAALYNNDYELIQYKRFDGDEVQFEGLSSGAYSLLYIYNDKEKGGEVVKRYTITLNPPTQEDGQLVPHGSSDEWKFAFVDFVPYYSESANVIVINYEDEQVFYLRFSFDNSDSKNAQVVRQLNSNTDFAENFKAVISDDNKIRIMTIGSEKYKGADGNKLSIKSVGIALDKNGFKEKIQFHGGI